MPRTVIPEYMYNAKGKVVTEGGLCILQALKAADFKRRDANDLCVYAGFDLFQAIGTLEQWGKDRKPED